MILSSNSFCHGFLLTPLCTAIIYLRTGSYLDIGTIKMSSKSTAASVKTSGNSSKAVKGWSAEENIQMLLMILKHSNPDLAVTGWNEIGKVAQEVFGGKYTGSAVK
ncbi:hypothetical protein F5B20DRAFT_557164 [Whalleya microplaca]|nr:hypothetical protein F5B20DRAFT_557164 [Whalleya microplaca]